MTDNSAPFAPRPVRAAGAARRAAILDAATQVFLKKGFEGASLADITELAGGSRRTIYDQFRDKEGLFEEMMAVRCAQMLEPMSDPLLMDAKPEDILHAVAERFLAVMTSEVVSGLRRIGMAEGAKFPRIASIFFERGVDPAVERVKALFEALNRRPDLHFEDTEITAIAFLSMLQGDAIDRLTARSSSPRPASMLKRQVEHAVAMVLSYGRRSPDRVETRPRRGSASSPRVRR